MQTWGSETRGQGSCGGNQGNELEAKYVKELVTNRNGERQVGINSGDLWCCTEKD